MTDPAGRVTTFTFSGSNLVSIEDPNDAITTYGYTSSHLMNSETNPDGNSAAVSYDSFTRMSSETLLDGTSSVAIALRRRSAWSRPMAPPHWNTLTTS